jgi:hypothetical protein
MSAAGAAASMLSSGQATDIQAMPNSDGSALAFAQALIDAVPGGLGTELNGQGQNGQEGALPSGGAANPSDKFWQEISHDPPWIIMEIINVLENAEHFIQPMRGESLIEEGSAWPYGGGP